MEALSAGIPAIAFSKEMNDIYDVVDEYILPITKELLDNMPATSEIWNVNFRAVRLTRLRELSGMRSLHRWSTIPTTI